MPFDPIAYVERFILDAESEGINAMSHFAPDIRGAGQRSNMSIAPGHHERHPRTPVIIGGDPHNYDRDRKDQRHGVDPPHVDNNQKRWGANPPHLSA